MELGSLLQSEFGCLSRRWFNIN